MAGPSSTVDQNLLPVQAYFDVFGNFQTFIGQGRPFFASINPIQSGLTITNSTIDSSTIGATTPSTGVFTNISANTGQLLSGPTNPTDITNKLYVDTVAQGLSPKQSCQVATTANITLSGLQTIDGYTTLANDRVLVKNQTSSANNGIYIASTTAWSRSADMNTWSEVSGAYTVVVNGTVNSQTAWVCTSPETGTIGTTAITFVQFSGISNYYAGTGLTLASNTFSITNTAVSAGSYGSASSVATFTVNAQGQLTAAANLAIAISNSQVSGLGTMSTQNDNAVAITGGSINGTTIGASTASEITGTTITATSSFSGSGSGLTGTASGLSIGGNAATATSAGSVTNNITFNNGGSGGASGSTFNGGSALTVSYNTIGSPSTTGTGASGTWGINITGNAATATSSTSATTATTATNLAGGAAYQIAYQTGSGATSFISNGVSGQVLVSVGSFSAPTWDSSLNLSGQGTFANLAVTGLTGYMYANGSTVVTASTTIPTSALSGQVSLANGGTNANLTAASGGIVYSGASSLAITPAGTPGQVFTSAGAGTPTWTTPTSYATVTDDTTTNATRYPLFANQTTGNLTTEYTSSTKLQYNPSTGLYTAPILSAGSHIATETITGSLSQGAYSYGTLSYSDVNIFASFTSNVNNYNQIVLQNTNSGSSASSDYVVSNNLGTSTTYYGDFGMNSSGWTGTLGTSSLSAPNVVYFQSASVDLVIGTTTANSIRFVTNSGADNASVSSTGIWSFANTVTASISGNAATATTATTATNANNVAVTDNTSSSATWYPTLVSTTIGNLPITTSSTKISFVPSTGTLSATVFNGSLAASNITGTLGTTHGGTGLTSFNANTIVYASSTSVLATSGNWAYNGTDVTLTGGNYLCSAGKGIAYLADATQIFTPQDNVSGGLLQWGAGGILRFRTNTTEYARISASGGFSIGNTTDPGAGNLSVNSKLFVGATAAYAGEACLLQNNAQFAGAQLVLRNNYNASGKYWQIGQGNNGTTAISIYNASNVGQYMLDGGTTWLPNVSDERLKNKVSNIINALDAINKLNPVSFYYKNQPQTGIPKYGHFAQDVGAAIPDAMLVSPQTDETLGKIYTYDPNIINVYLVAAINELTAKLKSAGIAGF